MADGINQSAVERPQEDEFGVDQKRMPFTDHLIELRWRVLICVLAVVVFALVFFIGFSGQMFRWMTLPVKLAYLRTGGEATYHFKYEEMFLALTPMAMFLSATYICLLAAVVVNAPLLVYQIWAFVSPGLKRKERMAVTKVVGAGSVLFFLGASFAYFVALPVMLAFFLKYTAGFGVASRWNISEVIDFETTMILVFGASFELPLVVVALTFLGILSPAFLAKRRRHAAAIIFIFAIVIAPTPDPVSQTCLAVPLILLYEIGYQVSKRIKRRGTLWDRWYGPVDQTPDEGEPGGGAPADTAPQDSSYPTYTENSAYSDAYAPADASASTPPPAESEGTQVGLPEPADAPPAGPETAVSPAEPAPPEPPAQPELPAEPQTGTESAGQQPTPDEGQPPPDQEWGPNSEPMH